MFKHLCMATLLALAFSACATVTNASKGQVTEQEVQINTSTGERVIAIIGASKVTLPGKVRINRNSGATITVLSSDNPGIQNSELVIPGRETFNPWFLGNIITGGTLGSTTDGVTGSMWSYSQQSYTVQIRK